MKVFLKKSKFEKKYEQKMTKFGKNGPKATRTRDHRGKAKASVKSELATAGAEIHPCINVKPVKYIIKLLFEFEKHARKLLLLPPIFNQPWNPHFLMKSNDVNIK